MKAMSKSRKKVCRTCVHWGNGNRSDVAACEMMESHDGLPDHPESLANVQDAEGYHAWVITEAEFGCVMHEEKHEQAGS